MYFKKAEEKYYKYLSPYKPLVVRLDAVEATKSHQHHLVPCDRQTDNFMEALIDTAKQLSEEYHCSAFASTDEINLIFPIAPVTTRQKKVSSKKWLKIRISDGVNGCQRSFFDVRRLRIGYKLHGTVTRNIFLTVSLREQKRGLRWDTKFVSYQFYSQF